MEPKNSDLHQRMVEYFKERDMRVDYDADRGIVRDAWGREHQVVYSERRQGFPRYDRTNFFTGDIQIYTQDKDGERSLGKIAAILLHEIGHNDTFPIEMPLVIGGMYLLGKKIGNKESSSRRDFLKSLMITGGAALGWWVSRELYLDGINYLRYGSESVKPLWPSDEDGAPRG